MSTENNNIITRAKQNVYAEHVFYNELVYGFYWHELNHLYLTKKPIEIFLNFNCTGWLNVLNTELVLRNMVHIIMNNKDNNIS